MILSVVLSAAVTFIVAAIILRASRKRDLAAEAAGEGSFESAISKTVANKGKKSDFLDGMRTEDAAPATGAPVATERRIDRIVFACDAGMGSSAMGASVLRNKIKKAGIEGVDVTNKAIANLDGGEDLIITQQQLTDRAKGPQRRRDPRLGGQLHELAQVRRGRRDGAPPARRRLIPGRTRGTLR